VQGTGEKVVGCDGKDWDGMARIGMGWQGLGCIGKTWHVMASIGLYCGGQWGAVGRKGEGLKKKREKEKAEGRRK
jgi:hypothetical protein